jgi:Glutamate 5-kinase
VKNSINSLIENGVFPIVNENDVSATAELELGDNDQLSAHVAHYTDSDILIIFSDIDGYYEVNPRINPNAKI